MFVKWLHSTGFILKHYCIGTWPVLWMNSFILCTKLWKTHRQVLFSNGSMTITKYGFLFNVCMVWYNPWYLLYNGNPWLLLIWYSDPDTDDQTFLTLFKSILQIYSFSHPIYFHYFTFKNITNLNGHQHKGMGKVLHALGTYVATCPLQSFTAKEWKCKSQCHKKVGILHQNMRLLDVKEVIQW